MKEENCCKLWLTLIYLLLFFSMACTPIRIKIEQTKVVKKTNQRNIKESKVNYGRGPLLITTFTKHSERVVSVAFSADSQFIASASYDNTVKLWNPITGEIFRTFSVESIKYNERKNYNFSINSSSKLAFSQDGEILTLGNGHNALVSWQIDTGKVVMTLKGRADYSSGTVFSPDGNFFANVLSTANSANDLLNREREQTTQQLSPLTSSPITGNIGIWDVKTGELKNTILNSGLVTAMAFSDCNKFLASIDVRGKILLWDLESKKILNQWQGFRAVTISPNAKLIAADRPNEIKVWNFQTGNEDFIFKSDFNYLQTLVFSSDSKVLASVDAAKETIMLWDLATGKILSTLLSSNVYSIAISPNSEFIASANFDNTVRVWKL